MKSSNRLNPTWFDHQRIPLIQLRRAVETAIDSWLPKTTGGTVVDVGAGESPYRGLFEKRGYRYVSCDIAPPADVIIRPGTRIPLDDACADVVVSFQVLEHVWELDWYLGECRRLLKPDGRFLISTHGVWLYHPHPQDFRRWTRTGLIRELEERNLKVFQQSSLIGPLAWTTQFRLLGYREVMSKIPVLGPALFPLVALSMNLRMSLEEAITPQSIRDDHASVYLCLCQRV